MRSLKILASLVPMKTDINLLEKEKHELIKGSIRALGVIYNFFITKAFVLIHLRFRILAYIKSEILLTQNNVNMQIGNERKINTNRRLQAISPSLNLTIQ